jgi:ribosomal protein L7Ae-like RNA K-turn-binding protein
MKKYEGVIGLAFRARKLAAGTESVLDAIRAKKAVLTLVTSDASEDTKKRLSDKCAFYGGRYVIIPTTKSELGRLLGKNDTAAAAFLDASFVKAFELSLTREETTLAGKEISEEK